MLSPVRLMGLVILVLVAYVALTAGGARHVMTARPVAIAAAARPLGVVELPQVQSPYTRGFEESRHVLPADDRRAGVAMHPAMYEVAWTPCGDPLAVGAQKPLLPAPERVLV